MRYLTSAVADDRVEEVEKLKGRKEAQSLCPRMQTPRVLNEAHEAVNQEP
jgi:hypothetical protein